MSNEQIVETVRRLSVEIRDKQQAQIKPLSDFLKQHKDSATSARARASMQAQFDEVDRKWQSRMTPSERIRGLTQIQKIREILSQAQVQDNSAAYRSKLASLGGAQ